jgi:hypothetical protein
VRVSYKVTWPGACRYYRKLKDARMAFDNETDPSDDGGESPIATALSKVYLTPDAFERSYNGQGGFEDSEVVLKGKL